MKEELIKILESIEIVENVTYPVFLQGTLPEKAAYPESFFTFWNGSTDDLGHYNNVPAGTLWEFDINFYSSDPELVNSMIPVVKAELIKNNWIVGGKGYDLPVDEPTHTGRGIIAFYREEEITGGKNNA